MNEIEKDIKFFEERIESARQIKGSNPADYLELGFRNREASDLYNLANIYSTRKGDFLRAADYLEQSQSLSAQDKYWELFLKAGKERAYIYRHVLRSPEQALSVYEKTLAGCGDIYESRPNFNPSWCEEMIEEIKRHIEGIQRDTS